jgi:phage shock protein C
MANFAKPIHRVKRDAQAGGVCAGIANWAGCHPNIVRVAYILLTVFTGFAPGIIAYVVLWLYLAPDAESAQIVA